MAYIYINLAAISNQTVEAFLQPFIQEGMNYNYYFKILQYIAE
jgi:hypothetical protein